MNQLDEYAKLGINHRGNTVVFFRGSASDNWPDHNDWSPDAADNLANHIRELAQKAREENEKPEFTLGAIYADGWGTQFLRVSNGFMIISSQGFAPLLDKDTDRDWRRSLKLVTSESDYKF